MSRSVAAVIFALAVALTLPATSSAKGAQLVTKSAEHANAHLSACIAPAIICAGGAAADAVGGAVGDVVSSAADSAMGGVVEWAANGAAWLVEGVAKQIEQSTRPELSDPWFASRYDAMIMLAAPFAGLFLLLAVGQAILAQDMARLIRAVCFLLPCALFVTFVAVTITELALRVTDEMTAWVLQGTGDEMKGAFAALGKVFAGTGSLAPFVLFLGATFTSLFALLVWLELVMREAAVYVAVAFLPLTFSGMVWDKTAHWSRKLAEWLLAIVLAKFTIAAAFALAAATITHAAGEAAGLSAVLAGCAVLLLAGLTPWALLRLLPFVEAAAGHSLSPHNVRGAATSIPGATSATFAARQLAFQNLVAMRGPRSGGGAMTASPTPTAAASGSAPPGSTELPQLPERRPAPRNTETPR